MSKGRVLIVDDDELFTQSLCDYLGPDGLTLEVARACASAEQWLREARWDTVVLDNHLPDGTGMDLARRLSTTQRSPLIMVTARADMGDALLDLEGAVQDYLIKPVDLPQLRFVVHRCLRTAALQRAARLSHHGGGSRVDVLTTRNPALAATFELTRRAASSRSPILIKGETGTGKTRIARAIHASSPLSSGPFVSVNCASIPNSLIEAELFGSVEGAFTGATTRPGLFELAAGGTLFLDEIGELPIASQATLLSAIEDGRTRRVGSQREVELDVRILAATHVDLDEAVAAQTFRADLLYRLDVLSISLPALRERLEDLPDLTTELLRGLGVTDVVIRTEELEAMRAYRWPGNLRELRNVLERAAILAGNGPLRPSQFISQAAPPLGPAPAAVTALHTLERRHILRTLDHFGGRRDLTAAALEISPATLRRRLREYRRDGAVEPAQKCSN